MTTQRELADEFFSFGNSLTTASSMRIDQLERGAVLIGGDEWIHAIRIPLDAVAVFTRWPRWSREGTTSSGWIRHQQEKVVQVAEGHDLVTGDNLYRTRPPRLSHDGLITARDFVESHNDTPATATI